MRWCCGVSSIEPAGPRLTAEQLAEKKKEADVIAAQLAKPGTSIWSWDKRGASAQLASYRKVITKARYE